MVNPSEAPEPVSALPTAAAAATTAPTVAPSSTAKADPSPERTTAKPVTLAADTEKLWLENMMVDEPYELLETLPDSLAGYVASFDDVASGTVEITVQENNVAKAELEQLSRSVFSLVGTDLPELERVEAVTADRLTRGVTNRREVPLLNQ